MPASHRVLHSITTIMKTNPNPIPLLLLQEEVNVTFRKSVHSLLLAKTTATLNSHPEESTLGKAAVSLPFLLQANTTGQYQDRGF